MTVEAEHVYQVCAAGVLVHNAYGSPELPPIGSFGGDGATLGNSATNAQFQNYWAQEAQIFSQLEQAPNSAAAGAALDQYNAWWDSYLNWFMGSAN